MHDKGNEENVFDRVDFKPSQQDSIALNFDYTRSWFQTPNSYDARIRQSAGMVWLLTITALDLTASLSVLKISARRSRPLIFPPHGLV